MIRRPVGPHVRSRASVDPGALAGELGLDPRNIEAIERLVEA
jgi:hypothetical protein